MSKPLTMRQDQWDDIRDLWDGGHPLQWIVAQGNVHSMFREIDALRAALAAAEAKLAEVVNRCGLAELAVTQRDIALADERRQLTAALEAERLHADALAASLFDKEETRESVEQAHAARRAHDSECESEFDSQAYANTPCGCAARRAANAPLSDAGASSEVANG